MYIGNINVEIFKEVLNVSPIRISENFVYKITIKPLDFKTLLFVLYNAKINTGNKGTTEKVNKKSKKWGILNLFISIN